MPKLFLLLAVLAIVSTCSQAAAQDTLFKMSLLFDGKDVDRTSPSSKNSSKNSSKDSSKDSSQETDKTNHAIALSLKTPPRILQQPDMMQYLTERHGKIPVYSGLDGKVQLEVGIAGYLGLKCQF